LIPFQVFSAHILIQTFSPTIDEILRFLHGLKQEMCLLSYLQESFLQCTQSFLVEEIEENVLMPSDNIFITSLIRVIQSGKNCFILTNRFKGLVQSFLDYRLLSELLKIFSCIGFTRKTRVSAQKFSLMMIQFYIFHSIIIVCQGSVPKSYISLFTSLD